MVICYNRDIQRKVDMNIRVRAAVQTAGIIGAGVAIAVAVQLILKYTPIELLHLIAHIMRQMIYGYAIQPSMI